MAINMKTNIKELKALISLLDDSDNEIVNIASSNIMNQGPAAIPELERAWETTLNETLQERLESVIQNIQFNEAKQSLKTWRRSEEHTSELQSRLHLVCRL